MSALGFILLFVSNQAVVLASAPYPPFGLAAVSFVGLSADLILVGIYSSAVSVAHDSELRKLVRTKVKEEFDLLRNIGTSQMEEDIQQKVTEVTTKMSQSIILQTGIEPTLVDEDIKEYCREVLQEIRKK